MRALIMLSADGGLFQRLVDPCLHKRSHYCISFFVWMQPVIGQTVLKKAAAVDKCGKIIDIHRMNLFRISVMESPKKTTREDSLG
jgi:hypothetical protein